MNFTAEDVKRLREATGAGFADCRNALTDAATYDAAIKLIEQKGQQRAERMKGQDRETSQGAVFSYIHHSGDLGVLVEINCSTDFVARTDEFRTLGKDIAVQIAGFNPEFISFNDIPAEVVAAARQEISDDPDVKSKPDRVREQVIDGKLKKQFSSRILMEQTWVKDESKTIGAMVDDVIRKSGENIVVRRFSRFKLGE